MDHSTLVFDALDVDLVVKVLANTAFSPFFTGMIPVFYYFHVGTLKNDMVLSSFYYFLLVSSFWFTKWCSRLYRNHENFLFASPPLDWSEQIVVITGGASGVGELLANTLAVRNVTVVVLDVKPIATENYNIAYYECDVSDWEQVKTVAKAVIEEVGQPTILVNNAGIVQGKLLLDLDPEDVKQTFNVNTLASFWTLKAFLPGMIKEKKGHIVTIGSMLGMFGIPQLSDYCASKAALISLSESLRYELDARYECPEIRTTLVLPGYMQTPMFSAVAHPTSRLFRFFFPSLQPLEVVKRIIASLNDRHSETIYLPFYATLSPLSALAPSFIRDLAQWVTGADHSMQGFKRDGGERGGEQPGAKSKH
ncbi:retinal short-chain dehydrogenase reductase [Thelephora terrestris]|uniref:Short-chain dehydrogenase/reductase 3 n=1 Tax=Thelephora terrestris TaxID=56493 RepID=A0A9P6H527_9AGAM|nr:retinal short-chain dehydrogenase reductase [Thelephora terrestris]